MCEYELAELAPYRLAASHAQMFGGMVLKYLTISLLLGT